MLRRRHYQRSGRASGVLDGLSSVPLAVFSNRRLLLSSYNGPLQRIRLTSGASSGTEYDIGVVGATGLLDTADRAARVGSDNWNIVVSYDQTPAANHLSQAVVADQPVGGTAGTGATLAGFPAADFTTGGGGVTDRLARGGTCGVSGVVAMSLWADLQFDSVSIQGVMGIGAASSQMNMRNDTTLGRMRTAFASGTEATFTVAAGLSGRSRILVRTAAGAPLTSCRMQVNGVECSQFGASNGSSVLDIHTVGGQSQITQVGCGEPQFGTAGMDGRLSEYGFFNYDLTTPDLALLNSLS